ncbi:MAG: hypothetical protein ABIE74_05685 [Pseudomonadota bacterium]
MSIIGRVNSVFSTIPEIARFQGIRLQNAPIEEWQKFNVGAVQVRDVSDYSRSRNLPMAEHNRCGIAIFDAALSMLVESRRVPSWLLFPARLFINPMTKENAETDAVEGFDELFALHPAIVEKISNLMTIGMQGVFFGVDTWDWMYQVPVMLKVDGKNLVFTPLARRCDDDKDRPQEVYVPKEYLGTRYQAGYPFVQVVCCGEISQASGKGYIHKFQVGQDRPVDYVLNLIHYYRWKGEFSRSFSRFVSSSMYHASSKKRCNAPVIGAVRFVRQNMVVDRNADPEFRLVAVQKENNPDYYLRPDDILWATTARSNNDDPCLSINLFGKRS